MKTNVWMRTYDVNDKSLVPLVLFGVHLGDYRNDIFCKWDMAQDKIIANYEKFFCHKLEETFGIPVACAKDVQKVERMCIEKTGGSVAKWMETYMENDCKH